MVDGDAHTPSRLVAAFVVALPGLHQRFDVGTVEVATHHAHALSVRPVQLAADGIKVKLLGRVGTSSRNNRGAIGAVEVHPFDRAVVGRWHSHVGPINVSGLHIDCDTIWDGASGDYVCLVGAVGVDGKQPPVAACFEYVQLSCQLTHRYGPFNSVNSVV